MQEKLNIDLSVVEEVNSYICDANNKLVKDLVGIIEKYGSPKTINAQAAEARKLSNLMDKLKLMDSPYYNDLLWLINEREKGSFVSVSQFRKSVLGDTADRLYFDEAKAVTLEISALQYFPWLITEAKRSIENQDLMPGRYIRVRNMKEQEADQGDILAVGAAMQIIGASFCESLDTRGTDGSNVHLGGPETITGYFGGIGQPNDHVLMWVDELLYYYTKYGINHVLNINPGTILAGYMLYRLGLDITFKVSVFMGNDNPFAALWTLMMAKMFSREDGTTPLAGFNLSNSVNAETIMQSSEIRQSFGLEASVRIEHHITNCYKSIVTQPYLRRDDLIKAAKTVPNIAAKHEGAEPEIDAKRDHPSDLLDYFRAKSEVEESGDMPKLEQNYIDKHESVNITARLLTENQLSFIAARNLHRR